MSKKPKPAAAVTEIIVAGHPSAALVAALRQAGSAVSMKQVADAICRVETARASFVAEAIVTGILLWAKREVLPHGERQKFEAEVWREVTANRKRVSDLPAASLDNFTRSLRGYRFLAQHFLADLEQGTFAPETRDMAVTPPAVSVDDALTLQTLPQERRVAVYGAIERFVGGRSLRRMLMDFRRAESASDQEEAEEKRKAESRKRKAEGTGHQLDFYDDMQRPLEEIERLMEDTALRETVDAAFWKQLATALEEQAKRARALAKEARS